MNKRKVVKKVVGVLAGIGAGVIVSAIISQNVKPTKNVQKLGVAVATFAISAMLGGAAAEQTDAFVDAAFDTVEGVVNGVKETLALKEEIDDLIEAGSKAPFATGDLPDDETDTDVPA